MSIYDAANEGATIDGGAPRRLYRIVYTDPPTRRDFVPSPEPDWSWLEAGPEHLELSLGISCFATLTQARNKAKRYPWLGNFIVTRAIPRQTDLRIERTIEKSRGHLTIWGSPDEIASYVLEIYPIAEKAL